MKMDGSIKHPAVITSLKRLRSGILKTFFVVCFVPLSIIFLLLVLGAGMVFALLVVLALEAERVLHPDTANGPDGIRAVLRSLIKEECGHEPAT